MEPDPNGLSDDQLIDAANAPQSMTSDNQSITERSADDLIKLDKYIRGRKAATAAPGDPFAGLRMGIISPPSTRGRQ